MSEFEFPSFSQPTEDARALLARLYREIGLSAIAMALDLTEAPEAPHADDVRHALMTLSEKAAQAA